MKNIAIGINIHGKYRRQNLCIDSLTRLQDNHPNVKLFNIQQPTRSPIDHELFETLYDNGRTAAKVVDGATMNIPMVRDFFNVLSEVHECEYFVFLNSDIILTSKIIKLIEEDDWDTISMSRLAIHDIKSIEDTNITHEHYQIAGFDVWAVKSSWWKKFGKMFPDYIYATAPWDVDYSTRMMVLGNSLFYTNQPVGCYHIIHPEKSHDNNPEHQYNMDLLFNQNKLVSDAWHRYLFAVIERRQVLDKNYMIKADGEEEIIRREFKNENIYSECNKGT